MLRGNALQERAPDAWRIHVEKHEVAVVSNEHSTLRVYLNQPFRAKFPRNGSGRAEKVGISERRRAR